MANDLGLSLEDFEFSKTLTELLDEQNPSKSLTKLKPQSWFTPNLKDTPHVDLFVEMTTSDLTKMHLERPANNNLTTNERKALKVLKSLDNVIIKPADKGGNIVLLNRDMYVDMCMAHLSDASNYSVLPSDPTETYIKEFEALLITALEQKIYIACQKCIKALLPLLGDQLFQAITA
ncbi:Hypothetical predicted protein [Pelobates cultripes]|uniref:Uncharacterized protein n=1 Tax=Pelobates cultripes TaxID=61616 RepID=A0AAD1T2D3_PELCU|nr:Hypothetical predicted protein [Pelobates cultripes]